MDDRPPVTLSYGVAPRRRRWFDPFPTWRLIGLLALALLAFYAAAAVLFRI